MGPCRASDAAAWIVGLECQGWRAEAAGTVQPAIRVGVRTSGGGQVHGDGECFTLVDDALRSAGAKSAADFGQVAPGRRLHLGRGGGTYRAAGRATSSRCATTMPTSNTHTDHPDGSAATDTRMRIGRTTRPSSNRIGTTVGSRCWSRTIPDGTAVTRNVIHLTDATYVVGLHHDTGEVSGTFWFYRPQAR